MLPVQDLDFLDNGNYIGRSIDTLLPPDHHHLNIRHCLSYDDWVDPNNDYAPCCDHARLDRSNVIVGCYVGVYYIELASWIDSAGCIHIGLRYAPESDK